MLRNGLHFSILPDGGVIGNIARGRLRSTTAGSTVRFFSGALPGWFKAGVSKHFSRRATSYILHIFAG